MPKSHAPYPPEFRAEAVRLVKSGGRDPEQLARDLGCSSQAFAPGCARLIWIAASGTTG
jgi:transposase-like protein